MFKPNRTEDRVDYGNILMPPPGYSLEKAVGTTYSLDLEAVTAMCISLGLSENAGGELAKDPLSIIHAIQKISDRVVIFCEDAQIKFRDNMKSLVLLLEKMIVPVALPKLDGGRYWPSFHPKTWLLKYRDNNSNTLYRFVVLSRNLTFDRSWDVIVTLDGYKRKEDTKAAKDIKVERIQSFVEYLTSLVSDKQQSSESKKKLLTGFIDELENVTFHVDGNFLDFDIMPLGIGKKSYDVRAEGLFNDSFSACAIMTPFLSGTVIENFNNTSRSYGTNRVLITRKTELAKLNAENAGNFKVYVIKDDIYNGEDIAIEETATAKQNQDIHAKIYVYDHQLRGKTYLYLGSMNATEAATRKNVEMMVRLTTKSEDFSCQDFIKDLFNGLEEDKSCPFVRAQIGDEETVEEEIYDDLELQLKMFCREPRMAHVKQIENGKYKVELKFELSQEYNNLVIRPLRLNSPKRLAEQMEYELTFLELCEFYAVTVYEDVEAKDSRFIQRIIMVPTPDIPDGRDKAVVNDVIKNTEDFLVYMDFVLGDSYISSLVDDVQDGQGVNVDDPDEEADGEAVKEIVVPAIYEKMLKTAVNNPERIYELGNVMELLKDTSIIPDGCKEMYDSFLEVLQEADNEL